MSEVSIQQGQSAARFGDAWNAFWFAPATGRRIGLLRIAVGFSALIYFVMWSFDLELFFAPGGVLPAATVTEALNEDPLYYPWRFSILDYLPNRAALWGFHFGAMTAATLCMLGIAGRAMTAITLVAALSYIHRAPLLMNPVEPLLAWSLLYLCIAPCGAELSIEALWAKGKHVVRSGVANNVALRLIQVHLAMHYFFVGVTQVSDRSWWTGNAVWILMAQSRTRGLDLTAIRESTFLLNGLTHLLVFLVFALALLPWNRTLKSVANWLVFPYGILVAALTGLWIYALLLIGLQIVFWDEATVSKLQRRHGGEAAN